MKFMISNFKKLNDVELFGINGGAGSCSGFYSNYCEVPNTVGGYACNCSGYKFTPVNNESSKPLIYILTTSGRTRF